MIDDKSCPQTNVTQNVSQAHCHTAVSRDGGRRATKKVKGRERKIHDPNVRLRHARCHFVQISLVHTCSRLTVGWRMDTVKCKSTLLPLFYATALFRVDQGSLSSLQK